MVMTQVLQEACNREEPGMSLSTYRYAEKPEPSAAIHPALRSIHGKPIKTND